MARHDPFAAASLRGGAAPRPVKRRRRRLRRLRRPLGVAAGIVVLVSGGAWAASRAPVAGPSGPSVVSSVTVTAPAPTVTLVATSTWTMTPSAATSPAAPATTSTMAPPPATSQAPPRTTTVTKAAPPPPATSAPKTTTATKPATTSAPPTGAVSITGLSCSRSADGMLYASASYSTGGSSGSVTWVLDGLALAPRSIAASSSQSSANVSGVSGPATCSVTVSTGAGSKSSSTRSN